MDSKRIIYKNQLLQAEEDAWLALSYKRSLPKKPEPPGITEASCCGNCSHYASSVDQYGECLLYDRFNVESTNTCNDFESK